MKLNCGENVSGNYLVTIEDGHLPGPPARRGFPTADDSQLERVVRIDGRHSAFVLDVHLGHSSGGRYGGLFFFRLRRIRVAAADGRRRRRFGGLVTIWWNTIDFRVNFGLWMRVEIYAPRLSHIQPWINIDRMNKSEGMATFFRVICQSGESLIKLRRYLSFYLSWKK